MVDLGLELIAVFLAVTLAFWAENLREARAERVLGLSYLRGILVDLRRDLAAIDEHLAYRRTQCEAAHATLTRLEREEVDVDAFFEDFFNAVVWYDFLPHRTAFREVVSTGNLRLVPDEDLRRQLLELESCYEEIRDNQGHIKDDHKFALVQPMLRNLRIKLPGPWSDDPRYEAQIGELKSNLLFENGLRALAVQVENWQIPVLEKGREQLAELIPAVEQVVAG